MHQATALSTPATAIPAVATVCPRLESVDLLRGLAMVVMGLDHTRRFFHNDAILAMSDPAFDPMNLATATPVVFLTRWVTHFCAPVFFLLAGTGAFLSASRGKTTGQLAHYLLTRGLWLVLLELTFVQCLGWNFGCNFTVLEGSVLWALGWSMVVLAALVYLPVWAISTLGLAMIVTHNLFDSLKAQTWGSLGWLWALLHSGETCEPFPGMSFVPGYPLLPWIGVMAVGYGFGKWLLCPQEQRRTRLLRVGVLLTLGFVALRLTNVYGDPLPWSVQKNGWFSVFSFINSPGNACCCTPRGRRPQRSNTAHVCGTTTSCWR